MIFDNIFKEIGDFGRAQIIQYFLLCWPFLIAGFLSVDVVFLMAVPDFVCCPDNVTMQSLYLNLNTTSIDQVTEHLVNLQKSSSNYKDVRCYSWNNDFLLYNLTTVNNITENNKCNNGFLYSKKDYIKTIPNEYDLVCDREYIRLNLKTIFFVGRIFGAVVFGQLSDLIGRLLTFLIVVICNLISGIGIYFSVSPIMVGAFLLIQGFTQVGYTLTTFVLGNEMVGASKRKWTGTVLQLFYTVAFMLIPFAYYYMQNWRYLALISGLPSVFFLTYYFFVYESSRWLLTKGKTEKVLKILEKVAKINKVKLSEEMKHNILDHNNSEEHRKETAKNYSILDLIRTKKMLKLSLNVWFNWIVNALIYYGIIYNTENLAGSLYLNFIWMGLVEIPAYCINILLLDRIGRKKLLIISLWATGLSCLIAGCLPKRYEFTISIVAMVGKFFVTISYGVVYFFTAELFPTVVRNAAMGISSMSARIGGTLAAPILGLQHIYLPLPMIIFALLSALAGALTFIMPETQGKPLDQYSSVVKKVDHEEIELLSKKEKA